MPESEWLNCTEPQRMLSGLTKKPSNRKCRLFAVACCRQAWHRVSDWKCRRAVELAELVADGRDSEEELLKAGEAIKVRQRYSGARLVKEAVSRQAYWSACGTVWVANRLSVSKHGGDGAVATVTLETEAVLLRCVCGNPFRPVIINHAWLTPTVTNLAVAAYEERQRASAD